MTSIKLRRGPVSDNKNFRPAVEKVYSLRPIGIGVTDKGYNNKKSHKLLKEELHVVSIIPAGYEKAPVRRTREGNGKR